MNCHAVAISIAGCVEEVVRDSNPMPFFHLIIFHFFFHAFLVFRYKKLHAALAIERAKPINQTKHKRNHIPWSTANLKTTWPKPIANVLTKKKNIRQFQHTNKITCVFHKEKQNTHF